MTRSFRRRRLGRSLRVPHLKKGENAMECQLSASHLSRRAVLAATAVLAAGPALAQECRLGPPPHVKGAPIFMGMDQQELDASYDQLAYEPLLPQVSKRLASNSEAMRARAPMASTAVQPWP